MTTTAGQRRKRIEQVITYAWNHKIRVHVLILLNEGTYTVAQIAEIIDEPLNNVSNHVRELLESGSIEIAKTEPVRNALQHYYRAVEIPYFSDEDIAAMTPQQVQINSGLVFQSMVAEVMAALWGGKFITDRRNWLAWDWLNVDHEGREAVADEQQRHWERLREIEVEATNRRAHSGEEAFSFIVAVLGFPRARNAPKPPDSRDRE